MGDSEWRFGPHRASLVAPDILRVTFEGPMVFEDARQALAIYREVCGERPRYLLADISRSSLDSSTRKYLGAELQPEWFLGAVYVGASLLLRVVTDALNSLVHFHRGTQFRMLFVRTEAEAFAAIEKWRAEREVTRS